MPGERHSIALDGLRGVAALSVVVLHLGEAFPGLAAASRAHLAVDFFFMLSGFVIGHAYEAKLRGGEMGWRRFAAIRLVRLYPMVAAGVLLGIAARFVDGAAGHSIGAIAGAAAFALLMLPAPRASAVPVSAYPLDGPLWSLTFELVSNLAYAAIARWLTTPRLAAMSVVLAIALGWIGWRHGGLTMGMAWAGDSWLALIRVFCPFAIGLLLFRLAGRRRGRSDLLSLLAAILLLAVLWAPVGDGRVYDVAAVLVAFPDIILLAMRSPDEGAWRTAWRWLGAISYPVYAINQPFFRIAAVLGDRLGLDRGGGAVFALASLALCIAAAGIVLRVYDAPVRRWLARHWLHRNAAAARVGVSGGGDKRGAGV